MRINANTHKRRGKEMKLSEFIIWLVPFAETNYSEKTAEWYRVSLNALIKHVGDLDIRNVTPFDLEKFKMQRKKEVSAATVNNNIRAIKSCFGKATTLELIKKDPTKKVKAIREEEQAPVYLSESDYKTFLRAMMDEPWFGKVVLFAIETGLRRGEITNLRKEDVDLPNKLINIHSNTSYRVKFGKRRVVTLNEVSLQIVTERMRLSSSQFLFTDAQDKPIRPELLTKKFRKYVDKLGLNKKYHFHSLRHTFGTLLSQNKVSLRDIQELMGHSRITVTEKYMHVSLDHLHESTSVMSTLTAATTGLFAWDLSE